MELDCQYAAGTNIDSQDCNQSSKSIKYLQFASSDDLFDEDGELHAKKTNSASTVGSQKVIPRSKSSIGKAGGRNRSASMKAKKTNSASTVGSQQENLRSKSSNWKAGGPSMKTGKQATDELKMISMKLVHDSANQKVAGGYDALYMAFNAKKQIKPKPKYLTTPVGHNIKDNEHIRKSVIADYLNRRSSQASQVAQELNMNGIRRQSHNGKVSHPNALHRQSFIGHKSPNVFRKSFLEENNPMYIQALPTDMRKSVEVTGWTNIRLNIDKHFNKGDSDGVKTLKPQLNQPMNELEPGTKRFGMLDGLELGFGSDTTEGDDMIRIYHEEQIKESEQFFQNLKKVMASTSLKVSKKAYARLKEDKIYECVTGTCNGKICTVPERKEKCGKRFPWLNNQ